MNAKIMNSFTVADPTNSKLFILGAGFSKPAGLPLGIELWQEILSLSKFLDQRAGKFNDDVNSYLEFQKNVFNNKISRDDIIFEDFLGYLDIEHYLGLRGSDTWSADGNEGTIVVKNLIGEILTRKANSNLAIPDLYIKFAENLNLGDYVITFNYDNLLERSLESIGKPFRLFQTRYLSADATGGAVDNTKDEVVILKMHGSIDWFDKTSFLHYSAERNKQGLKDEPFDPVFNSNSRLILKKLTDGPRIPKDPLSNIYRLINNERFDYRGSFFLSSPVLLAPSNQKHIYFNKIHDFWNGMNHEGGTTSKLVIIGYSFPSYDPYALQVVYNIVRNFQSEWYAKNYPWVKKKNLQVITYCGTPTERVKFKKRLRFINWKKASLFSEGFTHNTLSDIF
jgi:hypothetical protein